MASEDENQGQPDITAMLKDQTSACKAARDAIAAGPHRAKHPSRKPRPDGNVQDHAPN